MNMNKLENAMKQVVLMGENPGMHESIMQGLFVFCLAKGVSIVFGKN